MNYEEFDLDHRTCIACGLPEVIWWIHFAPRGEFDEAFVHLRCFNSPAARDWQIRQRQRDPAYDSYLKMTVEARHQLPSLRKEPRGLPQGYRPWWRLGELYAMPSHLAARP